MHKMLAPATKIGTLSIGMAMPMTESPSSTFIEMASGLSPKRSMNSLLKTMYWAMKACAPSSFRRKTSHQYCLPALNVPPLESLITNDDGISPLKFFLYLAPGGNQY
jgi:hypothetical protein